MNTPNKLPPYRIAEIEPPVYPCWLWDRVFKSWERFNYKPFAFGNPPYYPYWWPDQEHAPTVIPDHPPAPTAGTGMRVKPENCTEAEWQEIIASADHDARAAHPAPTVGAEQANQLMNDNKHFNGLTPAQAERLALLAEECGEVIQAVSKILRHGYDSHHPAGGPNNRETLQTEIGDIKAAVFLLTENLDLDASDIGEAMNSKLKRIWKYLHHNPETP